ncbi:hypothetical protein RA19_08970 [Leisingera sp. ANG-M1]|nr:hypothetical protein RA19_08970 [Leisingera sp. ANG-M1]
MFIALCTGLVWWGVVLLGFGWSFWKKAAKPGWLRMMVQISAASALASLFFWFPINLGLFIAPPLWPYILSWGIKTLASHADLLALSLATAGVAFIAASTCLQRVGKHYSAVLPWVTLFIPLATAWLAALTAASAVAELKIRRQAQELGATCLSTRSFASSLSIAGQEFGAGTHAYANAEGQLLQWSYRMNRFYPSSSYSISPGKEGNCLSP